MSTLYLDAVGVAAPGLANWSEAQAVLRTECDYSAEPLQIMAPELLPAAERRRSSDSVRLTLRVAEEALTATQVQHVDPVAIFSSAYGDPTITHKLCDMLSHTPPMASPILFHNSVQNAPAGYWSIATGHTAATTSISAGEGSFATGLLHAAAQLIAEQRPVLLVSHDLPYPPPLAEKCQVSAPFACALLLSHRPGDHTLAQLTLGLKRHPATTLKQGALESLRDGNPSAKALPLLSCLALGSGHCYLPYLAKQQLCIEVTPWS